MAGIVGETGIELKLSLLLLGEEGVHSARSGATAQRQVRSHKSCPPKSQDVTHHPPPLPSVLKGQSHVLQSLIMVPRGTGISKNVRELGCFLSW